MADIDNSLGQPQNNFNLRVNELGEPLIENVYNIEFEGATVTDEGGNKVKVEIIQEPLNLRVFEEGLDEIENVDEIRFTGATVIDNLDGTVTVNIPNTDPNLTQILSTGDRQVASILDGDTLLDLNAHKYLIECSQLTGNKTLIIPSATAFNPSQPQIELKILNNTDFIITLEADSGVTLIGNTLEIPKNDIACVKSLPDINTYSVTYQISEITSSSTTPNLEQVLLEGNITTQDVVISDELTYETRLGGMGGLQVQTENDNSQITSTNVSISGTGGVLDITKDSIRRGVGGSNNISLTFETPTANRTITFKDESGTVAFLSDITGGGGEVDSVNGQTGVVVLDADDVGLGNVDNTSDVDKPISTAMQTALDSKLDRPIRWTTPDVTHTGDTNKVILKAIEFSGTDWSEDDFMAIFTDNKKVGTAGVCAWRYEVNTSNSMSGSQIVASYVPNASTISAGMKRETFLFKPSDILEGYNSANNSFSDITQAGAFARTSTSLPYTGTWWLLITGQLANSADTISVPSGYIQKL